MNKKAAFHNLGCKVNAYETEAMMENLKGEGYDIVPFDVGADVYVINTCTVTNIADRKSRQMLHRAKEMNPHAVVVAVGCYVEDAKDSLKKDPAVDLVLGNGEKSQLSGLLESYFEGKERAETPNIAGVRHYEALSISQTEGRTRAFIKIQDGCNQFCSYCMIPYVRGRVRSRKPEDVIHEARRLSAGGYKEIILTGIHISSYGIDIDHPGQHLQTPYAREAKTNHHLLSLIRELSEIPEIERIRLGSLEPGIMTEEFVKAISQIECLCPQFHLSMQSGCDETLRRMKRKYDTDSYRSIVGLLRRYFKHPAITTDIIVGFPMESEEEFCQTLDFVKEIGFAQTHIFKYSPRKGTVAASMKEQVPEDVKKERSRILLDLDRTKRGEYAKSFVGQEVSVLTEERKTINGTVYMTGHTKEYVDALIPTALCGQEGTILTVRVASVDESGTLYVSN